MAKLRKGGPKKKDGLRDARGRLIPAEDRGTPELRAMKIATTGSTRDDMSSLGVLHGRKLIDDEQYEAGLDFERCYRAYIGRPDPVGNSLERREKSVGRTDEAHARRMKIRYWNCLAALSAISPHVFNLVRDVCLFERSGGLMGEIIAADIRCADGALISRREAMVSPPLRRRIGAIVRGLEILQTVPKADYSREADQMIARLRSLDPRTRENIEPYS